LDLSSSLPAGFAAHVDMLPLELLECIQDIVEMQHADHACSVDTVVETEQGMIFDNMLASIEFRLMPPVDSGHPNYHAIECVRLAVLITCFLSCNKMWANNLVPCRFSQHLSRYMTHNLHDEAWNSRLDLQLWCIYVGAITTVLDPCPIDGLSEDWTAIIQHFHGDLDSISILDLNQRHMKSAVEGFVYCKGWSTARSKIPGWQELESVVDDRMVGAEESESDETSSQV
jgi:hypothetical protein